MRSRYLAAAVMVIIPVAGHGDTDLRQWSIDTTDHLSDYILNSVNADEGLFVNNMTAALIVGIEQGVPGAELTRHFFDMSVQGGRALESVDRAIASAMLTIPDQPLVQSRAAAVLVMRAAEALHRTGTLSPGAAAGIGQRIELFNERLLADGWPSLFDQTIASYAHEVEQARAGEFLDWMLELPSQAGDPSTLDAADDAFRQGLIDMMTDALPPAHAGALPGTITVVSNSLEWTEEVAEVSARVLDLVAQTIETGRVDHPAFERELARLNRLRHGPYSAATAREFIGQWCDLLPIGSSFCQWIAESFDDEPPADMCTLAINCDCENGDYWGQIGYNQCMGYQESARTACRSAGLLHGFCDPVTSGPAAYPE